MSLFAKFLKPGKPKWQHDDPAVRKQALAELPLEQIPEFLNTEPTAELRAVAVVRLTDEAVLEKLLSHSKEDVREAARSHWLASLLPAGTDVSSISDSSQLVRIAGLTKDDQVRLTAISAITDQQERLTIARSHPVARVRLVAAEGITEFTLLEQLMGHAQGKDKTVYRLCKERLAEAKAADEAKAEQQARIQTILEQAAYLNRVGYGPEFNGRLQVLGKQREEFADVMSEQQRAELDQQIEQAKATLQGHEAEEQRLAAARQQAAEAEQHQASLLNQLSELVAAAPAMDPTALGEQLSSIDQPWRASLNDHKPSADALRQFENTLQQGLALQNTLSHYAENQDALQQWLEKDLPADMRGLQQVIRGGKDWLAAFKWPADVEQPSWLAAINGKYQLASAQLQNLESHQASRIDTIEKQLAKVESYLDDGHLKEASKAFGQATGSIRQIDNKSAQRFQHRIKSLNARINEMRDWQGYATTPKKESLCDAMEALIGADIDPETLSNEIQALQDEWKTLNSSTPDKELWERFQAAGDKAFEPCRDWFASAAQRREQNIALRNQLIDELSQYEAGMDWQNADWKVVQKTLEAARETFRGYSPVERSAHKDTQARFRDVCDRIYDHLKAEYDNNLAIKSDLVEQAAELANLEDLTGVVDKVKSLQQQWKQVGTTPRGPDQKLWREFRSQCDAIFNRLDEQRAERRNEIDGQVAEAEALVQQAQALLEDVAENDANSTDARASLQQIESDFAAIELPRGAHQRLRKALNDVGQTLQQRESDKAAAADRQRWQGLLDRLTAIQTGDEALWQAADKLPGDYAAADFEQRWDNRDSMAAESEQARDLCIRMEILAEQECPAADQGRRMELQVQRLANGMGQGVGRTRERAELVANFLTVSASTEQQGRFIAALAASLI